MRGLIEASVGRLFDHWSRRLVEVRNAPILAFPRVRTPTKWWMSPTLMAPPFTDKIAFSCVLPFGLK